MSFAASAQVAAAQQHAHEAVKKRGETALLVLTPSEARDIEALTAQIIPSDGSPGAREAGAVYFIDRALATFDSDKKESYQAGLALVRNTRARLFPGSPDAASLTADQQIALLQAIEKSDFFELLRTIPFWGSSAARLMVAIVAGSAGSTSVSEKPHGVRAAIRLLRRSRGRTMKFRPSETVDFLIIGAGAAGGVMAKELSTAGFKVVVVEQGPYLRERDFKHDEIRNTMHHGLTNNPKIQPVSYRRNENEPTKLWKAIEYGRQVGGGTVHFTANYWRLQESDFHERSLYGDIPGTGFADWPVTYADLEPYYSKAEYDIGISGLAGANPFESPRSRPYPLPPMPVKSSGVLFERAARKLGLHPFPAPVAVISQDYQGRGRCVHCGFCELFGCEMRSKSSTLVSVIPAAERTGRCEVRPDSYVRKLEVDEKGRVTGAVYFDAKKREVLQRSRVVVVCANGVEDLRVCCFYPSRNRFPTVSRTPADWSANT